MSLRHRYRLFAGMGLGLLVASAWLAPSFGQNTPQTPPAGSPTDEGGPGGQRGRFRGPGGPRGGPGRGGPQQEESVEGAMRGLNRAARQLRDSIGDASKKDENLHLISEMEKGCASAKSQPVPEDLLKAAGDDAAQAKLKETYHTDLFNLLKKLVDLEQSVTDGKTDAAKTQFDEVMAMQKKGHTDLGVKMGPGRR